MHESTLFLKMRYIQNNGIMKTTMQASLWGPTMWHLLFACAWSCPVDAFEELKTLLFEIIPKTLPCVSCRRNYVAHIGIVHKRAHIPRTPEHAFRWLWYMKDEVNKALKRTSIPMSEFIERYVLHGSLVNEVEVADMLMLVAIVAHAIERDDEYIQMCHIFSRLLPLPPEAALVRCLSVVRKPIVNAALCTARNTRKQHAQKVLVRAHYQAIVGTS